ncbi:hypothetical protein [Nocardia sp. NPDC059228]|uniref:hypothetical protein n=1 Tax=Nocardia sp. NPDC059228 TaxID=3346777 RepID=UPI0036A90AB0
MSRNARSAGIDHGGWLECWVMPVEQIDNYDILQIWLPPHAADALVVISAEQG